MPGKEEGGQKEEGLSAENLLENPIPYLTLGTCGTRLREQGMEGTDLAGGAGKLPASLEHA